jgi:glycosyltransferase involved in cell wall biosynthesis
MRVAIAHDYLTQFGGAERVLDALMELWPNAPVFTLLYDKDAVGIKYDEKRIKTSFLQKVPGAKRHHRYFPLMMPLAAEQFNFSGFDVVVSNTHSFTKGIITHPRTLHVSYCFTPTRYVWDDCHRYVREFSRLAFSQRLAPTALSYVRLWDYYASQRVGHYLTSSQAVARRIKKYYHREAEVVPPPVDVERFYVNNQLGEYYLVVSRLVSYKRVDLAIEACERMGRKLKIVGVGPEQPFLEQKTSKYTEFLGFVPDEELPAIYAGARALLFPQEEDFGITPLEAAAAGKATIAYGAGGALETVLSGKTGMFFEEQTVESLIKIMREFEKMKFNPAEIRKHAQNYGRNVFLRKMEEAVHTQWDAHQSHNQTRI